MAKVYSGRVAIPGDKFIEYLRLQEATLKEREPFKKGMKLLNEEFYQYLLSKYSKNTAEKHSSIVDLFIDFLWRQTDVERIEEITRGMVNTHFKKWYKNKVWDSTKPNELTVALRKFFQFLESEKSIQNPKAMKGLQ